MLRLLTVTFDMSLEIRRCARTEIMDVPWFIHVFMNKFAKVRKLADFGLLLIFSDFCSDFLKKHPRFCSEVRSAENEYENGNLKMENEYDTNRNILRKIILRK